MQKNKIRFFFFLILFSAMLIYPADLFILYELDFQKTIPLKFRIRSAEYNEHRPHTMILIPENSGFISRERKDLLKKSAFAVLTKDKNGFGIVSDILPQAPTDGSLFVRVEYYGCRKKKNGYEHRFVLPFNEYILNRKLSEKEQKKLIELSESAPENIVVNIRLYKDGAFVYESLAIDGIFVESLVLKK